LNARLEASDRAPDVLLGDALPDPAPSTPPGKRGFEEDQAIPWVLSWTQACIVLPPSRG